MSSTITTPCHPLASYQVTSDDLEKAAAGEALSVYCGFDPTADSLHLGNLLGIIVLSWFQRCGGEGGGNIVCLGA